MVNWDTKDLGSKVKHIDFLDKSLVDSNHFIDRIGLSSQKLNFVVDVLLNVGEKQTCSLASLFNDVLDLLQELVNVSRRLHIYAVPAAKVFNITKSGNNKNLMSGRVRILT